MLDRTLKELSDLGIHVVLVGQTPEFGRSPGRCVAEKEFYNRSKLGNCLELPSAAADKVLGIGNEMIAKAATSFPGTTTFLLSDVFCRDGTCRAGDGEKFFYVDADHLSATGAHHMSQDPALRAALLRALGEGGNTSAALAPGDGQGLTGASGRPAGCCLPPAASLFVSWSVAARSGGERCVSPGRAARRASARFAPAGFCR